jgi:hypothetical protein
MSFFQIAPITKVSTQIHSSICQYDVYKVSSKKNEWKGSIGGVKVDFLRGGGDEWVRFSDFAGFQVVSTLCPMLMTPYPPHITTLI